MSKVYFIGAGPGDPELITVKGWRLLRSARVVIYAGSLINPELLLDLSAEVYDSYGRTLEEIVELMARAVAENKPVVRLHSGDTAFYSAINEEVARLKALNIPYEVVPGVSSASLGAAKLGLELTVPEVAQTVVFTRLGGKTPGPSPEDLSHFAREDVTLVIFLSVHRARVIEEALLRSLSPDTPVAVAEKLGFPEERIVRGRLADLARLVEEADIRKTALIYVGKALKVLEEPQPTRSRLYGRKD